MLKYKLDQIVFNEASFLADFRKRMDFIQAHGIRVFIRATMNKVPVWSGASRASLIPLAHLAKIAASSFSGFNIKPVAFAPRDFRADDSHHGIASGYTRGEKSSTFERNNSRNDVYGFTFYTSVFQYWLLEGKWQSIQAGQDAWISFIHAHAEDAAPTWTEHLKVKTLHAR